MLLYLLLGLVWVLVGDMLLARWVTDPAQLLGWQIWKGWAYVALTSGLTWWFLRRVQRAENSHTAMAHELAHLLRHAPAGIARVALDGQLLWANHRLCVLLGASLEQVVGLDFPTVIASHDRDWAKRQLACLIAGEIDHYVDERYGTRLSDGSEVPVLCTVTLAPRVGDEPAHLVCVVQDLQEIKATRADLQIVEARQRLAATVVDNTIEGVIVTDAKSRILSVNAAFTRLLGYTEQELLGKTPAVLKSGRHDAAFYAAMWKSIAEGGHWQGEIWNRRKSGEVFPEHMSLSAVRDPAGEVTHYVCVFSDISQDKQQQSQLEFLARNDPLTGLPNRAWFGEQLHGVVQSAQGNGECLAVLLLNIDRFKDVNDSYGHATGDEVLRHIALQVRLSLRPGDLLGRMSGDELAVVVRHLRHADGAESVARNLIRVVAEPWQSPDGIDVVAGVSVGICMFPEQANTAELLMQGAHAAVYGAKAHGRGTCCFYNAAMTQAARERLELEARLRAALAQGYMLLHYQPQVDIATGRIIGAEALVRWNDPQTGLISPARFIPVAETSGVIGPLGTWVLREACRQAQQWREAGLPDVVVAVNVSPVQFQITDLASCVAAALRDSGFSPHFLELEITESALAERTDEAREVLSRLRALGVRIAVDDFGTGYSSLAQLKRFPIDVLKIDQGFIRELAQKEDDRAISAAIIAMGHSLGMTVLAEGVETEEQLAFLRARGCDTYQGYLCSRPLPAADFAALLGRGAAG